MKPAKAPLRVRIVFSVAILILAFNAIASLYWVIASHMGSQAPDMRNLLNQNVLMVRAFLVQVTGYRITMLVVGLFALLSKRASHIFLFSIGIVVLNAYQAIDMVVVKHYGLELSAAIIFISIGIYCIVDTVWVKAEHE